MTSIISGLAAVSIGGFVNGYVNGRVDKKQINLSAEKGALTFGVTGFLAGAQSAVSEKGLNYYSKSQVTSLIKNRATKAGAASAIVGGALFASYGLGEKLGIEHAKDAQRTVDALKERKTAIDPSQFEENSFFGTRER